MGVPELAEVLLTAGLGWKLCGLSALLAHFLEGDWDGTTKPMLYTTVHCQVRDVLPTLKVKGIPCECSPESFTIGCDTPGCSSPAWPGGPSSQHRGPHVPCQAAHDWDKHCLPLLQHRLGPSLTLGGALSHWWVLCRPCSCTAMVFSYTFA